MVYWSIGKIVNKLIVAIDNVVMNVCNLNKAGDCLRDNTWILRSGGIDNASELT